MNNVITSNSFQLALRAFAVNAKATQLIAENTADSDVNLKANQARALAWVVSVMLQPEPQPSSVLSGFEMSGSMTGEPIDQRTVEQMVTTLLDRADGLLSGYRTRTEASAQGALRAFSYTPEDTSKALRFAQDLIKGTYTGTKYVFCFTDGDGRMVDARK